MPNSAKITYACRSTLVSIIIIWTLMALKEKMQIHSGHRLAYVHTYVNLIIIDLLHFFFFFKWQCAGVLGYLQEV